MGEIAERIIRKNEKLESTLPLTISAQYGLIDQNEFFDKRIASKDVRGYYLIKKGEFAYNKSTSVDAPLGAIKRLDKYKNGVLSTLYILFKIIDDTSTSSDYLVTYYATDLWHRGIQSIAAEGARNHGLLNIAPNDFFETMLSIPFNISEQKKVGDFFITLDHLITLHQSKPFRYIFKAIVNCTLYWEQRKTSDLFKITRGYVLAANITAADKSGDNPYPVYSSQTKDNGLMGYYKDYLYENAITWTTDGANAGTVNYRGEKFYCTNVCGVLLGDKVTPNQMLAEAINNVAKGHVSYVGNPKLMNNVMAEICIWLPSEDTERKAISTFVYSLDRLITLHQLEPYKLIFKAIAYRIIDYAKSKPPRCIK